jgi:hypothetical protein
LVDIPAALSLTRTTPPPFTQFHNHPDFEDPVGLFAVFDGEVLN